MSKFFSEPVSNFKILGIYREDDLKSWGSRFKVFYRNHKTGEEMWFARTFNGEILSSYDARALLMDAGYQAGGADLALAMEEHFYFNPAGWTTKPPELISEYMDIYSELEYSPIKTIPVTSKLHFDYGSHQEHVHNALNLEKIQNYFTLEIKPVSKKSGGPNMADVDALPGLKAAVKHPPPKVEDAFPTCQEAAGGGDLTVKYMVMHLNDLHKWTREEIADWLESLDVDLRFKSVDDRLRESKEQKLKQHQAELDSIMLDMQKAQDSIKKMKAQVELTEAAIKNLQKELDNVED